MDDRIISANLMMDEQAVELSLRPRYLAEYIGQNQVKENLKVYIEAAKCVTKRLTMCCCTDLQDSENDAGEYYRQRAWR